MSKIIRQGDVLLVPVAAIPSAAKRRKRQTAVVLAEGEVTGHSHVLTADRLEVHDAAEAVFVKIMGAPALLKHEEHSTLTIEAGVYRVVRQREYQPRELPRRVAD